MWTSDANVWFWTTVGTWTYQNQTQVWVRVQRNHWTEHFWVGKVGSQYFLFYFFFFIAYFFASGSAIFHDIQVYLVYLCQELGQMTVGLMNEYEHGLGCHMMMNDKGMGLRKSQQTCVENEQTGGMMKSQIDGQGV